MPAARLAAEIDLCALLKEFDLVPSTSEARRMIQANAVEINGAKISALKVTLQHKAGDELVVKVGKKKFAKLKVV